MTDMLDDIIKQDKLEGKSNKLTANKDVNSKQRTPFSSSKTSNPKARSFSRSSNKLNINQLDLGRNRSKATLKFIIPIIVAIIIAIIVLFLLNII